MNPMHCSSERIPSIEKQYVYDCEVDAKESDPAICNARFSGSDAAQYTQNTDIATLSKSRSSSLVFGRASKLILKKLVFVGTLRRFVRLHIPLEMVRLGTAV